MPWRELNKLWYDTSVDYCDVCGNLLIRRYFEFTAPDGRLMRACREEDERLLALLEQHRRAERVTTGVPGTRIGDRNGPCGRVG